MLPIEDYAAIGDGRSVALVGRDGAVDWLCWPRFDSPSLFGALLDERAGHWRISPRRASAARRRYLPGTNVLETTFEAEGGVLRLTDFMSVQSEKEKETRLSPDHEIVRVVECIEGDVEVEMELAPRTDYGARAVAFRRVGALGVRAQLDRAGVLALHTSMPVEVRPDRVIGRARLRAGESFECMLDFEDGWPATLPAPGHAKDALERTVAWWRGWIAALDYEGPARDLVERSALVLKLLVYAPSGAIVAAPTTSLPERLGGDLNWDYRFCWLRDASLTVRALFGLGFSREAEAFVSWLLHATRLTWPRLRVLYDVYGNCPPSERMLESLTGYRSSRPVRIGNAAISQTQLDVYGEVIDAVTRSVHEGARLDRSTRKMLLQFGEHVCRHGGEPDEGIWEPRSGARHNTHSRLLSWAALDRLIALHAEGHLTDGAERFRASRDRYARDIREGAWNETLGSYASTLGGDEVDASLLLIPWYGFEPAGSPRMRATRARIRERLGGPHGLLHRYKNADSPGEGAFGIACFWDAEYLALGGGSLEEAEELFRELCGHANDVGLFAEEIDPATGAAVGNFPQGFTHIGVINAALSLRKRRAALEGSPEERAA